MTYKELDYFIGNLKLGEVQIRWTSYSDHAILETDILGLRHRRAREKIVVQKKVDHRLLNKIGKKPVNWS